MDSSDRAAGAEAVALDRLIGPKAPFELEDVLIEGRPARVFRTGPRTLNDIYARARQFGERTSVVDGAARVSFRQLFQAADACSEILRRDHAVGPGSRVGLVLANGVGWLTAFVAVTQLGAAAAPIDPDAPVEAIGAALALAGCDLAILGESQGRAILAPGRVWVMGAPEDVGPAGEPSPPPALPGGGAGTLDPSDIAMLAFTSGTTGPPKAIVLDHRSLVTGLRNMLLGAAMAAQRRPPGAAPSRPRPAAPCTLMLAPLSHVGGYAQFLLALMIAGKIVFPRGREAEDAARLIEAEGVQSIAGAPVALVRDLVAHRRAQGGLESLAAFQLHGSALASGLVEAIRSAFPQASVGTGYGLTETNGSIAVATDDDLRRKPGCSGRVLPTVEVRIQDEAGRACEPGQAGEIWLRGAMVMRGYAGLAGAGGGLRDGWFRTGDRGRLDDDGFLFVLDRAEDVITLGTRRLSCSALARWVEGLAGVDEAAVLPLDGHGRLLLAVAPAPGRPVDLTALGAQLQTEIAAPQAQVTVVAWDRLPRTRSGKVDAAALRAVSSRLSEAVS